MKKIENIAYGLHPDQKLDLFLPDTPNFSTFVYFHGGGFESTGADKTKGRIHGRTRHRRSLRRIQEVPQRCVS